MLYLFGNQSFSSWSSILKQFHISWISHASATCRVFSRSLLLVCLARMASRHLKTWIKPWRVHTSSMQIMLPSAETTRPQTFYLAKPSTNFMGTIARTYETVADATSRDESSGKHVHEALPCQRSLKCNRRWDSSIWGIPQFEGFASLKSCAAPQKAESSELSRFFCTSELNGTGRPTLTVLSYLLNSIQ